MPATSGGSHAAASFLSIVIGVVISEFLSTHADVLADASRAVGTALVGAFGVSLPTEVAGMVVVATLLSFCWGVAYHYTRHGS